MNKKFKKEFGDLSGLVRLLSNKFDGIDKRFDELESMFRDLQGSVDAYAKRADAYFQGFMKRHRQNPC